MIIIASNYYSHLFLIIVVVNTELIFSLRALGRGWADLMELPGRSYPGYANFH
jgi:hypothetical protein